MKVTTILLMLCCISNNVFAQAISISPGSLEQDAQPYLLSRDTFYVNGIQTHGLTPAMGEQVYVASALSHTLITLLALRMTAAELLHLDEAITGTLPDVLEENPFNVAVTPRHILTETAGFALPPIIGKASLIEEPKVSLKKYAVQVRTAGQVAHTDPVGWEVLAMFLERKGNAPILDLIKKYVLAAITSEARVAFKAPASTPEAAPPFRWVQSLQLNGYLIAEISRLFIRNRDRNGALFLPPELYEQLAERHNWRMHPIGPRRSLGGEMRQLDGHTYIAPAAGLQRTDLQHSGAGFLAFPRQGIAFVHLGAPSEGYLNAIKAVAADHFLPAPPDTRLAEALRIHDARDLFSGTYVRSDAPSAWLKKRLEVIERDSVQISESPEGVLTIKDRDGILTYKKQTPYYFISGGNIPVILSPFRSGGYMDKDGVLYRYAGPLGNKTFLIDIFPAAVLLLLSSALYMKSKTSGRWRKMALYVCSGTLMVSIGTAADYYWWPTAIFEWDTPWLVMVWRAILNIGLALVLSMPLFALAFTRRNEMPAGQALLPSSLHLAALSISALALFLILVGWGLAGEFSAY